MAEGACDARRRAPPNGVAVVDAALLSALGLLLQIVVLNRAAQPQAQPEMKVLDLKLETILARRSFLLRFKKKEHRAHALSQWR